MNCEECTVLFLSQYKQWVYLEHTSFHLQKTEFAYKFQIVRVISGTIAFILFPQLCI